VRETQRETQRETRLMNRFMARDNVAGEHSITSRAVDTAGNVPPTATDPAIANKQTYWESNGQITQRVKNFSGYASPHSGLSITRRRPLADAKCHSPPSAFGRCQMSQSAIGL
jgi:hypothetical protein